MSYLSLTSDSLWFFLLQWRVLFVELRVKCEVAEGLINFFKEVFSTLDINENSYITNPDSINISKSYLREFLNKRYER